MRTPGPATIMFSIDVDAGYPANDQPGLRQLDAAVSRLLDLLRRRQVQATWAMGHLAAGNVVHRLVDAGHEVAVLAEPAWAATAAVDRKRFVAELACRTAAIAKAGGEASTLVLHNAPVELPLDVLVRQGVRLVRSPAAVKQPARTLGQRLRGLVQRSAPIVPARDLRHGIVELVCGPALPWADSRKIARRLNGVSRGPLPLAIDLPRLAHGPQSAWGVLENVVQLAAELREAQHAHVSTMAQWLAAEGAADSRHPARSILARAA